MKLPELSPVIALASTISIDLLKDWAASFMPGVSKIISKAAVSLVIAFILSLPFKKDVPFVYYTLKVFANSGKYIGKISGLKGENYLQKTAVD
jgi:hypothetical protein